MRLEEAQQRWFISFDPSPRLFGGREPACGGLARLQRAVDLIRVPFSRRFTSGYLRVGRFRGPLPLEQLHLAARVATRGSSSGSVRIVRAHWRVFNAPWI
ncbi:MAG TPA: hypothetical protein VNM72_08095 [Blastocatellia bacterium]|nr:hypothetical protein [Blastocatellia bacterium]